MFKKGDIVVFTEDALRSLGRYADNLVHEIDEITTNKHCTIVTFKNEAESYCDIIWLKKVE